MAHDNEILGAICGRQEIIDEYKLTQDFFTNSKYKRMFSMLNKIHQTGKDINDGIIMEYQKKYDDLALGDFILLPKSAQYNIKYYVDRQHEHILKNKFRVLGLKIADYAESKPIEECIDFLEKEVTGFNITQNDNLLNISDGIYPAIQRIEEYYKNKGALTGVTSGYQEIDEITNGFQDGELIILGARASIGKTALALNMAARMIKKNTKPGFFSCEMSSAALVERILISEAKLNSTSVKSGRMRESDFHGIQAAASRLFDKDLWIDDTPNIDFRQLKSQARVMRRKGAQIIFVDYLTLIKYPGKLPKNERVGETSKGLKALARELEIPIIALSQVTRDKEGKRPTAADLRWSGEIEEDADMVLLICRDRKQPLTELIIDKNRNGACVDIPLYFIEESMRFEERRKGK